VSQPNRSTAVGRVVIDELVRGGIAHFVISPGSRSAALAMAAFDHPGAQISVALDERSAGFRALGMSKAGTRAAVIVTSGTAVANLYPAVIEAEMSLTPLIVLTADRPVELRGVGANQTIDQVGAFGGHATWSIDISHLPDTPEGVSTLRSTMSRAAAVNSGPAQVNIGFDEPLVPLTDDGRTRGDEFSSSIEGRANGAPWTAQTPVAPAPVELSADIVDTERGLVIVGSSRGLVPGADQLAGLLGWPLIVEPTAGFRPPQTISTAHFLSSAEVFAQAHRPDVVLMLGRPGLSRPVERMIAGVHRVVYDAGRWSDPTRQAETLLSGPPVVGFASTRVGPWRRSWLEAEQLARHALDEALDSSASPFRIARDLARVSVGPLVVASSMPVRLLDAVMPAGDTEVIANRGASGIDGFVSTALGVATSRGMATAFAGDLSMLHDMNGFLVDTDHNAAFVVLNDNGGGIFSHLPPARFPAHFERLFGTPHGRSFERYAAFHNVTHVLADPSDDLGVHVRGAADSGGIHLIETVVDREGGPEAASALRAAVDRALRS